MGNFCLERERRAGGAIGSMPLFHGGDGGSIPTSALDLHCQEIDMRTAAELNQAWHSLLPRTDLGNLLCGNMSVAYAMRHLDDWYAVAIYSQPIVRAVCDGCTIELRRMAISDFAPKNTASRFLAITRRKLCKKFPWLNRIVSYQAVDVHSGTIYKAAGWTQAGKIVNARPQRFSGSGQRATGPLQTTSRKVRWEIFLKKGRSR